MADITETLKERGEFNECRRIGENIQTAMEYQTNFKTLSIQKKMYLALLANEAGRIINGDPECSNVYNEMMVICRCNGLTL